MFQFHIYIYQSIQIIYHHFQTTPSNYNKGAKIWKFYVVFHNAKILSIFDPLAFYTCVTICIKDALLYLKCLFLDTS